MRQSVPFLHLKYQDARNFMSLEEKIYYSTINNTYLYASVSVSSVCDVAAALDGVALSARLLHRVNVSSRLQAVPVLSLLSVLPCAHFFSLAQVEASSSLRVLPASCVVFSPD